MKVIKLKKSYIILVLIMLVIFILLFLNFNNIRGLFGSSTKLNPTIEGSRGRYSDTVSEICNNIVNNDYFMTVSFGIYQNYGTEGNVNVILESTDGKFTFSKNVYIDINSRTNFSYAVPKGKYKLTITKVKKQNAGDSIKEDFLDYVHNEIINEKSSYFTLELLNKDRPDLIISGHMSLDLYYEYLRNSTGGTIRLYKNPNAEVSFSQENFKITMLGAVVKDILKKHNIRFDYNNEDIGNVIGNVILDLLFATIISENQIIAENGLSFRDLMKLQLEMYNKGVCGTIDECFGSDATDSLKDSFGSEENFLDAFSIILDDDRLPVCTKVEIMDGVDTIPTGYFYLTKTKSLIIPKSVKYMEEAVFSNAEIDELKFENKSTLDYGAAAFMEANINKIVLPEGVKTLGAYLFSGLKNPINSFFFPNSLVEIGSNCFEKTTFVDDSLDFKRVEKIGDYAFKDSNLKKVKFQYIKEIGDYAFEGNQIQNYSYSNNVSSANLIIPKTIEKIGDYAFNANKITNLTFDVDSSNLSNLKVIGKNAFNNNFISDLTIPNNELNDIVIDDEAFRNNNIINVNLGKSVVRIGKYAFYDNYIEHLTLSENLKEIDNSAFKNNKISELKFNNKLEIINYEAFKNNVLTELDLPNSLINIGNSAFANNLITSLKIPKNINHIYDSAFEYNKIEKLEFLVDSKNKKNNLILIDDKAFYNNLIKEVYFPNTNNSEGYKIGCYAFSYNKIEKITLNETVFITPKCNSISSDGSNAFLNNNIKLIRVLGEDKTRYNDKWVSYGFPKELKVY